ncbi:MAG: carboxy terminal-processing peptidase [Proteobacteria bacterium]|nr:carboxy terminal-processing peptidase [Pseudomonadota bacterium]
MKPLHWCLTGIVASAVHAAPPDLAPQPWQGQAANLASQLIGHYHYTPVALDDIQSERIFARYLKALDPDRLYFLQADINGWQAARHQLDDAILGKDLRIPFAIYNRYARRADERFAYARKLLAAGFDFNADETYPLRRDKADWARSTSELDELWRKRVKNDWLQLRLAGQDDDTIRRTLERRYTGFQRRLEKARSEDAFQLFMGAYTASVDPHTAYLGARAADDLDISMRLSLVGIGAVLEEKDDYATIRELTPGGPAAASGRLHVGDRIVGVGEGEQGQIEDVLSWRLDDIATRVRGKADTVVRLDILPGGTQGGQPQSVALVRKKISLDDQAASKAIVDTAEGGRPRRIGVITLPAFYQDFEARNRGEAGFRSATRDVARLLAELRAEQVDGLLIDLRDNGGGSLDEAVELTGLFIETGPVVQQRDARGRNQVSGDNNPAVAWNGPLAVLIDRNSASASEIFAAAIQDYRRGVVVGETSYGKGSVQTLVNLDRMAGGSPNGASGLGELKFTIQQFYRINGSTTQLRGVKPDVVLPVLPAHAQPGEASFDNALPFQRIRAANYDTLAPLDDSATVLQQRHAARVAASPELQAQQAALNAFEARQTRTEISLKESTRRTELAAEAAPPPRPAGPDLLQVEAARVLADRIELPRHP